MRPVGKVEGQLVRRSLSEQIGNDREQIRSRRETVLDQQDESYEAKKDVIAVRRSPIG